MTVSLGFRPEINAIIQDNTLRREFEDSLFPNLLYRMDAMPEMWNANIGDVQIFTRTGLLAVDTRPVRPGSDPTPDTYDVEQYRAEAAQHTKTVDTHLPTNYLALASTYIRDTKQLGLNAGQTVNRIARNRLYRAYLGGDTSSILAAVLGARQVTVASINGFTERLVQGQLAGVSTANPIAVSFTEPGVVDNAVIGAVPLDSDNPFGPGVLTLANALNAALPRRSGVKGEFRPEILRAGAADTVDGLTGASRLVLQDIINAVSTLRDNNVPTHMDGYYHVHISPFAEAQLFSDEVFQQLNRSLPDDTRYHELIIGDLVGARFYRNRENPKRTNVGPLVATGGGVGNAVGAPDLGAEIVNEAGIEIRRTIVTGGNAMREMYIPEGTAYMSEVGVQGDIGTFNVVNGGVEIMADRIRYIARKPQDRLQQVVSQTWSWSGDFVIPSDSVTDGPSTFKRSVVIEHA